MLTKGSSPQVNLDAARLDRAVDLVNGWLADGIIPGAVLLVARYGQVVLHKALGQATVAPPGDMRLDTIFPVASIAKPVTAAAAMLLVERGYLWLDTPVAEILPKFAPEGQGQVRIRHLMTHTSGLNAPIGALIDAQETAATIIDACCKGHLAFVPGTQVAYSGVAFWVLRAVIAEITGQPFAQFCRANLFEPLAMKDTFFVPPREVSPRLATIAGDEAVNEPYFRHLGSPSGGLFATAWDLARFAQMFLDEGRGPYGQVLSPATVKTMIRDQWPHLEQHEPDVTWRGGLGLGWGLRGDRQMWYVSELATPGTFSHSGATGALLWADPAWELVGVLLTNQAGESASAYARRRNLFSGVVTAAILAG